MKRIAVFLLLSALAASARLSAQVSAGLTLSQDQFLPGESIPVAVRITNFSGQTLHLGANDDWLQFTIESADGYLVPHASDVPVQHPFDLETATVATRRVDLGPHYAPLKPGRYKLTAIIRLDQWQTDLGTQPKDFDVIAGTVLWEQPFGLPLRAEEKGSPEVRRYALQQAIHLKQMKLYVRVTEDSGNHVFGIFPLGPMLTFSTPEKQIDKESHLHVLYQTGARTFNYSVINPDGKLVSRQTHEYRGASRPVLKVGNDGKILVQGGLRRPARDDLPPSSPEANLAPTPITNTPVAR